MEAQSLLLWSETSENRWNLRWEGHREFRVFFLLFSEAQQQSERAMRKGLGDQERFRTSLRGTFRSFIIFIRMVVTVSASDVAQAGDEVLPHVLLPNPLTDPGPRCLSTCST